MTNNFGETFIEIFLDFEKGTTDFYLVDTRGNFMGLDKIFKTKSKYTKKQGLSKINC